MKLIFFINLLREKMVCAIGKTCVMVLKYAVVRICV